MNVETFTQTIIGLGEVLSLPTGDLRDLSVMMVVLNLRYVDRKVLFDLLFPGQFVDWKFAPDASGDKSPVGDLQMWLVFLELCTWEGLDKVRELPSPVSDMRDGLRVAGLDPSDWTIVCKLLILHKLFGIQSQNAFQVVAHRSEYSDASSRCTAVLQCLVDRPRTPAEYVAAFACVLSRDVLKVDVTSMTQAVSRMQSRQEERHLFRQMQELAIASSRPRLRDRQHKTATEQLSLDVNLSTWESYQGWLLLHQFPNVLMESTKHRLYFLASQTAFDWASCVKLLLGRECELGMRVGRYPVSKPDVGVLSRVIQGLRMKGGAPFPELVQFRVSCLRHFPVSLEERLDLTHVLRLYVCAYQNPSVWKELWKQQVCLLSTQIIRDCRTFADATPFACAAVVGLMLD